MEKEVATSEVLGADIYDPIYRLKGKARIYLNAPQIQEQLELVDGEPDFPMPLPLVLEGEVWFTKRRRDGQATIIMVHEHPNFMSVFFDIEADPEPCGDCDQVANCHWFCTGQMQNCAIYQKRIGKDPILGEDKQ